MVRPRKDFDSLKEDITNWFLNEKVQIPELCKRVHDQLGVKVEARTMASRLKSWGISRYQPHVRNTTELRLMITVLFQKSYSDQLIVRQLARTQLADLNTRQVATIRKQLGLTRRMSIRDFKETQQQLERIVRQELDSGKIDGYGKELLQKWFRRQGVVISRY